MPALRQLKVAETVQEWRGSRSTISMAISTKSSDPYYKEESAGQEDTIRAPSNFHNENRNLPPWQPARKGLQKLA